VIFDGGWVVGFGQIVRHVRLSGSPQGLPKTPLRERVSSAGTTPHFNRLGLLFRSAERSAQGNRRNDSDFPIFGSYRPARAESTLCRLRPEFDQVHPVHVLVARVWAVLRGKDLAVTRTREFAGLSGAPAEGI